MGTRFRRSFKVAPGVRVNLNKKSASISFGPKGLKHTVSTTGEKPHDRRDPRDGPVIYDELRREVRRAAGRGQHPHSAAADVPEK